MKIKFITIVALICLPLLQSCEEEEQVDQLIDTVERGAILRTVEILSNEFPFDQPDSAVFSVILEEQDQEDGGLLESVDIFTTFVDGSDTEGDSSNGIVGQEVAVRTIDASEFTTGENGLPVTTLTITLSELLGLVNLTPENIFGGDTFTTRLVLNLTDGRSFTNDLGDNVDVNGNIASGSFFQSPFRYTTPIVCPIGEEEFIGDYVLTNVTAVDFGNLYADGQIVTLEAGETSVERMFTAVVLEDLNVGQPATPFVFQLICNEVVPSPDQSTNLQCGGGSLTIGTPVGDDIGVYNTGDDSTFTIVIGYNESGAATCASPSDAVITLSRQ